MSGFLIHPFVFLRRFLSDGNTFGSGSDDGTCRLFDIRTGHQLITFADKNPALQRSAYPMCVTSIGKLRA
jgi:WD40 repeat protein